MKKSDQLKKTYDEIKAKINDLQEAGETKKAYDLLPDLKNAEQAYKVQLEMEKEDLADFLPAAAPVLKNAVEDKVMRNRIFNKLVLGIPLNEQERDFYAADSTPVQRVDDAAGTPGQVGATPAKGGYLVPEEQMATLREYRKAYTSLKTLAHVQTANSTSGSMPTLGDENGVLTNFEEITNIKQSDFDFGQLKYEIKDYGDIIPVSNQLLQDADVSILDIIGQRFARKSINTENQEILGLLGGLSSAELKDYKSLMKALNVDLDPAYYAGARIVTNQDGFQWMSELEDNQKRPLLVPDVAAQDTYRFRGKEIFVLSNTTMATKESKIPFYIGSIGDYVAFFQRLGVEIAVSQDFLFDKYATALRCVERFGVVADDKDAVKAYNVTIASA